jgi:hypothetical protein
VSCFILRRRNSHDPFQGLSLFEVLRATPVGHPIEIDSTTSFAFTNRRAKRREAGTLPRVQKFSNVVAP